MQQPQSISKTLAARASLCAAWLTRRRWVNLQITVLFVAIALLLRLALVGLGHLTQIREIGLLHVAPVWLQGIVVVLAMEFGEYAYHRSAHTVPALWRFHAVHHSDEDMDLSSTFRQHPIEEILRFLIQSTIVFLLGAGALIILLHRISSNLLSLWAHSRARTPRALAPLGMLLILPEFHRLHHSGEERHKDKNFAAAFVVFDRLFGTYLPPPAPESFRTGLISEPDFVTQSVRQTLASGAP